MFEIQSGQPLILVVDDDAFQRDTVEIQLGSLGWHQLKFATSGNEALAHLDRYGAQIIVIISDLSMPDMDGLVLMRHLAQRHCRAGIILRSGLHDEILNSAAVWPTRTAFSFLGCCPNHQRICNWRPC